LIEAVAEPPKEPTIEVAKPVLVAAEPVAEKPKITAVKVPEGAKDAQTAKAEIKELK